MPSANYISSVGYAFINFVDVSKILFPLFVLSITNMLQPLDIIDVSLRVFIPEVPF